MSGILSAQLTSYIDQVKAEIEKRGISEEELNLLLLQRGLSIEDVQTLSPDQLSELQRAIEELEANKDGRSIIADVSDESLSLQDTIVSDSMRRDVDTSEYVEHIYGQGLIRPGRFALIESKSGYQPPSYYRVGAGDEISVSIFSRSAQVEELLTAATDGSVRINDSKVKVFIAGLTLAEVREKLIRNYRRFANFSDGQISIHVSTVRQITVQVFGEVEQSGAYTAPAVNSVVNFVAAAGGMTDLASVRRIKLIKKSGAESIVDLYKLLSDPSAAPSLFLEDGDLIFVPTVTSTVNISGAIKRPHTYEIIDGDGVVSLIKYAGGLGTDAYTSRLRILRYEGDRRVVKNVDYKALVDDQEDFMLAHGDMITVDTISALIENYVRVIGEVRNAGEVERYEGMRLRDLVVSSQLRPTAKTDFAFIKRTNSDGTVNVIPVSLEQVLDGSDPSENILLRDGDELTVWPQSRFEDDKYIKIAGAVRYEESIPYDNAGVLRASDAIRMAGGLRRDAEDYAHVHRFDPLTPNERQYIRIDLSKILKSSNDDESNIVLEPFDSIHIYSRNDFQDEVTIAIEGAVNNPGEFAYGDGLTLKDAIILAGGFKSSSATNNIEVSRVLIQDNQPTKTIIEQVSLNRDELTSFDDISFELEPFDNVFVRYVPEYELQQNIIIEGEVVLPGHYSLIEDNETVYDVIGRSGGLTEEAFPSAATLYRAEDSLGYIVMRLDEVMQDKSSRYNYTLKGGDRISIPKKIDYVTIEGATQLSRVQDDSVLGPGSSIRVPYHGDKDAIFYIEYYAGGFADDARRDKIYVVYPNGEVRSTERKFLRGKRHPEILPGSRIQIGRKKSELYGKKKEEDVNWTKVLGDSVAQAMSILTLILLVQRLD